MIKKINKELLILIIGRVLQIFITLVSIRIVTKYLEVSEMGNLYLIMSIVGFYGFFFLNPIGQYINRYTHQWYEQKNILNVFYLFNIYVVILSLLSFLITYLMYQFGVGNNIDMFYFIFFIALFIYFNTWNQVIISMINMLEGRIVFVVFTLVTQILTLILAVYLISYFGEKGIFWFFGQVVAYGFVAFLALFYFVKKIQNNFSIADAHSMIKIENLKKILHFSLPLSAGVLFLWMQTQSYGIIIEKMLGVEFLGYFGVGLSIAFSISSAFESIVMQYLYPMMYKSMKEETKFQTTINNILSLVIPLYFLLAIFVSLFAIYMITLLVDMKYYDSYIYTIFGIWIAFFRMSSNMIANIAHAKLNTKKLVVPYSVAGILSFVGVAFATQFNFYQYLIPFALLFASFVGFLSMFFEMNKLVNIKLNFSTFYSILFYSIPFLVGLAFYSQAFILEYSLGVLTFFGSYFLYILYIFITKGVIVE